jgi:uncharacterized surface protein with fasciclin (FAS1) repeats
MSDSDPTLPDAPGSGTPPPPPPPPPAPPVDPAFAGEPTLPDNPTIPAEPTLPGDPTPPGDPTLPGATDAAAMAPTTQMPATGAPDDGVPPTIPPDAPVDPDEVPEEPVPWYKKPGPIAALIVVLLAIGGLVAWLVLGGDDDDDQATATSTFLVFETIDETSANINVGFFVDVTGPADAEKAFVWLRPEGVPPGGTAGASTGSDGRVAFEWEADDTVADPAAWQSTVTAVAQVPPGWTPPGPNVDCVLRPFDGPATTVSMNVVLDSNDDTIDRAATLTFPNHTFAAGDSVTCKLVAGTPAPTTVVDTTVVETTVVETTVVETTEVTTTTVPPTTVAPTTVPPETTTTSIDIPPPAPGETLWDLIDAAPSLTQFKQFVIDAGFQSALEDPNATFTIFAPTNEAIDAARAELEAGTVPVDADMIRDILLAHANDTEAIELADLLKLPSIEVLFGGPQPITADPPTVGGAKIYVQVPPASNGVLYLIDTVLTPQP